MSLSEVGFGDKLTANTVIIAPTVSILWFILQKIPDELKHPSNFNQTFPFKFISSTSKDTKGRTADDANAKKLFKLLIEIIFVRALGHFLKNTALSLGIHQSMHQKESR